MLKKAALAWLWFTLLVWLGGCSSAPPQTLHGRWLDVREDTFFSFADHGLCAEVRKSPESVVIHRWEYSGSTLSLTSLTPAWVKGSRAGEKRAWTVSLRGDKLKLTANGRVRKLQRIKPLHKDPLLAGLWGNNRRYAIFTAEGEAIMVYPFKAPRQKIAPTFVGEWYQYRLDGSHLTMDGYSPFRRRRHLEFSVVVSKQKLSFGGVELAHLSEINWKDFEL